MSAPPTRLIILYNPRVEHSAALAAEMSRFVTARPGVSADTVAIEDAGGGLGADGHDLIVVLGGDGSMLRTGTLAAQHGIPILGVNLGRLSFLGEVQPDEWPATLLRVLDGDYWIEARMM